MQHYYLKNGTRESGPYLLDDLKYQRINADTLVKEEGGNWVLISQKRELRFLLEMSEGSNSYSDSHGKMKQQQVNPVSDRNVSGAADSAKARIVLLIAVVIALAVAGAVMALFFSGGR